MNGFSAPRRSTVGCVIPAVVDPSAIAQVVDSLLSQTRLPDVIHVVVVEPSGETVTTAARYAGPHARITVLGPQFTEVFVHDIARKASRRAGALNYGYSLVEGYDYLLGVGGDTIAESRAVEHLEAEVASDARIGGVAALAAVGSRFSIFSTQALRDVMDQNHRSTPWVSGGASDSQLMLQLNRAGYFTRTSPFVRAVTTPRTDEAGHLRPTAV